MPDTKRYHIQQIQTDDCSFVVDWDDGHQSRFHWIWLRDNGPVETTFVAGTSQRVVDAASIRPDIKPLRHAIREDGSLEVDWDDGETAAFDPRWLRDHCYSKAERQHRSARPRLWTAEIVNELPGLDFSEFQNDDDGVFRWLGLLTDFGFALLRNVPAEVGQVEEVANKIGFVRETNYGRLFDVESKPRTSNLAYTPVGLAAHTDNPYRNPVLGIQLLHCLQASPMGGESIFVDGFRVAEELRATERDAFETLARVPRQFEYREEGTDLRHETTLIHLNSDGEIVGIRYNDRAASTLSVPEDCVEPFYDAYRKFVSLLRDSRFELRFKLEAGDLIVFDNERVLHGRTAFNPEDGPRHLQGCYVDRDGVASRLRVLAMKLNIGGLDPGIPGGARLAESPAHA